MFRNMKNTPPNKNLLKETSLLMKPVWQPKPFKYKASSALREHCVLEELEVGERFHWNCCGASLTKQSKSSDYVQTYDSQWGRSEGFIYNRLWTCLYLKHTQNFKNITSNSNYCICSSAILTFSSTAHFASCGWFLFFLLVKTSCLIRSNFCCAEQL